jgi:agmatine deiminase
MGIAASTSLLFEDNPSLDEASIKQLAADYLNISTYHIVEDPNSTYIDHIDCWGKFLSLDMILIRQVPPSDPQYQRIEDTAAYFQNAMSSYGMPRRAFPPGFCSACTSRSYGCSYTQSLKAWRKNRGNPCA